jgi:hypothetical protein
MFREVPVMKYTGLLYAALLLVSCATGERITNLREGLTKAEVIEMLGRPDGFQRSGDYEQLQYTNRIIIGWS